MNPTFQKYNDYIKYRNILKKIKNLENLDGLGVNDLISLSAYKPKISDIYLNSNSKNYDNKLYTIDEDNIEKTEENKNKILKNNNNNNFIEELDENELNNLIVQKKRHSTITFSQRMLKKADNLTKFNRKNHSEGNKHITNDYL